MKGRDIAGIVMGVPLLLLGLLVGLFALRHGLYSGLVSATLLFISVGLFIPSRLYERGTTRAIGFIALSLAIALAAGCVVAFGVHLNDSFHEYQGDDATALLFIAIGCLMASVFPLLGTWVLQTKLNPRKYDLAVAIAAGILALALGVVFFYAWYR